MPLAENLKSFRDKRGLTQQDLAAAAETTRETVALIEIGKRRPSWKLLARLAAALGTTESKLIA